MQRRRGKSVAGKREEGEEEEEKGEEVISWGSLPVVHQLHAAGDIIKINLKIQTYGTNTRPVHRAAPRGAGTIAPPNKPYVRDA